MNSTSPELRFDGWTVNRVSGEMTRGGRTFRLPQQPLRVLIELHDHAGEVVTREQLVKALWPQGIVDFDNGLNVAVRKLRVALDDVGDMPRYIETLPRVGYRFIAEEEDEQAAPGPPPQSPPTSRRGRWLPWALAALTIVTAGAWWWTSRSQESRATATPAHVPTPRARELYLEGIHARSRRDMVTYPLAIEKFEAALREDPNYPEAWAALSDTLSAGVVRQIVPPAQGVPKARAAAQRALELDDHLAVAHAAMATIHFDHDKDFAAAERELRRALELDDRSARVLHHFAMVRGQQGHVEEALDALRRARELEPMTLLYVSNYAYVLINARRYEEAIEFLRPAIEANPNFSQARATLARALMATGDYEGAMEQLEARTEIALGQADLGVLYAKMGRRDDAMAEIARLERRAREGFGVAYDQAVIYTTLGDVDMGCELLARAVTDGSILVNWMRLDPRLDPLRGRQCFLDAEKRLYGGNMSAD